MTEYEDTVLRVKSECKTLALAYAQTETWGEDNENFEEGVECITQFLFVLTTSFLTQEKFDGLKRLQKQLTDVCSARGFGLTQDELTAVLSVYNQMASVDFLKVPPELGLPAEVADATTIKLRELSRTVFFQMLLFDVPLAPGVEFAGLSAPVAAA